MKEIELFYKKISKYLSRKRNKLGRYKMIKLKVLGIKQWWRLILTIKMHVWLLMDKSMSNLIRIVQISYIKCINIFKNILILLQIFTKLLTKIIQKIIDIRLQSMQSFLMRMLILFLKTIASRKIKKFTDIIAKPITFGVLKLLRQNKTKVRL